ncbi:MAG: Gfo/Idh/MocA family oxidoreductase [Treponema sp.]|nr:Gfo/Idh/MocA family oxidoreductase [Treponema sp.]
MSETVFTSAIIGTGRISFSLGFDKKREQPASHTMALIGNRRIKLIAGCDRDEKKLESWRVFNEKINSHFLRFLDFETPLGSEPFAPLVFGSSEELYRAVHPDIVTVAVNEDSHMAECLAAIKAKPRLVILEKPVALNSFEAGKIMYASKENNVPVMVNHERRFSADYIAAKNFIPKIGDIQSVRGELFSGLRVYGKEFEADGSYSLLHDGTHLVDLIQFLLGIKLKSPRVSGVYKDEKGVVRNFTARYKTENIPEIQIQMSGRSKFFSFGIDILGTLGRICVGNGYAKFYLREESKLYTGFYSLTRQKVRLPKKTGYFSNMIQNAVDFLDGTAPLISPLEDAVHDLKVLEDIKTFLF